MDKARIVLIAGLASILTITAVGVFLGSQVGDRSLSGVGNPWWAIVALASAGASVNCIVWGALDR